MQRVTTTRFDLSFGQTVKDEFHEQDRSPTPDFITHGPGWVWIDHTQEPPALSLCPPPQNCPFGEHEPHSFCLWCYQRLGNHLRALRDENIRGMFHARPRLNYPPPVHANTSATLFNEWGDPVSSGDCLYNEWGDPIAVQHIADDNSWEPTPSFNPNTDNDWL